MLRKYFITFIFSYFILSLVSALEVDLVKIKPIEFVEDQTNSIKDGRVYKISSLQYYGEKITYIISAEKNNPSNIYVYYYSDNPKSIEYLSALFYDYVKDYGKRCAYFSFSNIDTKDGKYEIQYVYEFPDGSSYLLYGKVSLAKGIEGFGVTLKRIGSEWERIQSDLFFDAKSMGGMISSCSNYQEDYLRTSTIYTNIKDFKSEYTFTIGENKDERIGEYSFQTILQSSFLPNSPYLGYTWRIKIDVKDQNAFSDMEFLSQAIELSNTTNLSFAKIINANNEYVLYSETPILGFALNIALTDVEKKYAQKAIITIKSEK